MLNIALPKGRLGDKVYEMLKTIGYECDDIQSDTRKLIFVNEKCGVKYFLAKPSDVATYVEYGAADIGVVGKDILVESESDVYELLDLNIGKCRMAVAGRNDYVEDINRPVRVATKFPNVARKYYRSKNREIDIIKLSGSIEIAPVLNMSDVIVDIVETGTTLKENDLSVFEEIFPISARLIANKSSYKFKTDEIDTIVSKLRNNVK